MAEAQKQDSRGGNGPDNRGGGGGNDRGNGRPGGGGGRDRRDRGRRDRPKPEFDQELVDIARVTRIVAGGRRFRFRVTVVLGDRKGRVGIGTAKGTDVAAAADKAASRAKRDMIRVPIVGAGTIPHETKVTFKGARLFLKPAAPGTGVIAGGSVRTILELAGYKNVYGKMHGSNNAVSNLRATAKALEMLETPEQVSERRGVKIRSVVREAPSKGEKTEENTDEKKTSAPAAA